MTRQNILVICLGLCLMIGFGFLTEQEKKATRRAMKCEELGDMSLEHIPARCLPLLRGI